MCDVTVQGLPASETTVGLASEVGGTRGFCPCPPPSRQLKLDFKGATLIASNLGGLGGPAGLDSNEEAIRYGGVARAADGAEVDLVVTVAPGSVYLNGGTSTANDAVDGFATITMGVPRTSAPTETEFVFTLVYSGTTTPLDPPPERFDLSFYDLDKGSRVYEVEEVVIGVDQITAYSAVDETTLEIARDDDKVSFSGTRSGGGGGPEHPVALTFEEAAKTIQLHFQDTSEFRVTLKVSRGAGKKRFFIFSGESLPLSTCMPTTASVAANNEDGSSAPDGSSAAPGAGGEKDAGVVADGDTGVLGVIAPPPPPCVADAAEGMALAADVAAGATTLEVESLFCSLFPFVPPVRVEINAGGATAEVVTVVGLGSLVLEEPGTQNDHAAGERVTVLPDDNPAAGTVIATTTEALETGEDDGCSSWYDVCWYWWIFGGSGAVCCLCGCFLCTRSLVKICTVEIEDPEAAAAAAAEGKAAPKKKKRRASIAEAKRNASVMVTAVAGGAPDADIAVSISLKRGGPASLARQKSSPTSKPLASKTSMPIIHKMPSVAVEAPPPPPLPPPAGAGPPLPPGWEEAHTEDGETFYWNEGTGESSWDRPVDRSSHC